jgi:hypothetical protein
LDAQQSWINYLSHSLLEVSIVAWNAYGRASWPAAPASWPVTMTYEGAFAAKFAPEPKTVDVVPMSCTEPLLSDGSATVVCTYDLAATQPRAPTPTTPQVSVPSVPVVVAPRFTG